MTVINVSPIKTEHWSEPDPRSAAHASCSEPVKGRSSQRPWRVASDQLTVLLSLTCGRKVCVLRACACVDGRGAAARRETKRRCAGLKGERVGLEEGRGPTRGGVKRGGVARGEFSPRGCGEKSTPSVNCEIPARPRTSSLRLACCGKRSVIQVFWIQLGH